MSQPNQPKAYLFDIGNVILGFDFSIAAEKLVGADAEEQMQKMSATKNLYEAGGHGDEEFIALASEELEFSGSREEFVDAWQSIFHLNQPMVETLQQIAATGRPLHLLSNTNGLHMQGIFRDFPIFSVFSGGIYSHEAKSMKPDKPMYEQAIERFDLEPAETLYIDDLPANIETGRALGFRSFQYDIDNHAAFVAELGDL